MRKILLIASVLILVLLFCGLPTVLPACGCPDGNARCETAPEQLTAPASTTTEKTRQFQLFGSDIL